MIRIVNTLVTEFDNEELPLRKRQRLDELIIENDGDVVAANKAISTLWSSLESHKNFTRLLTDAAMNPQESHVGASAQKFAIAMSRNWIVDAYNDLTAQNRMKIPHEIEFTVDKFGLKTVDGSNETDLLGQLRQLLYAERQNELAATKMSVGDKIRWGVNIFVGLVILCNIAAFFDGTISAIICFILALVLIGICAKSVAKVDEKLKNINATHDERQQKGEQYLRAVLAEVRDYRTEFSEKDAESNNVTDFLNGIDPAQYVRNLPGAGRRVRV